MRFPDAGGYSLNRRFVNAPNDLLGEYNIALISFQDWQQTVVNSWIPFVRKVENTFQGIAHYEFPVIQNINWFRRTFLSEGMRVGVLDPVARERTITLYLDKPAFRQELGLQSEETIYILLIDRVGNVLWQETGYSSFEKTQSLCDTVFQLRVHGQRELESSQQLGAKATKLAPGATSWIKNDQKSSKSMKAAIK